MVKIKEQAEIGVFGGSGFYDFLAKIKEVAVKTPYGKPSDKIAIGEYDNKKIAFLPRHGKKHQYPPHKIPYRANIYAFKMLGVKKIIAPGAAGSLNVKIKPGDFVIPDQFFDRTKNRQDTFFNGPKVAHISSAFSYCPTLKKTAAQCCQKLKISYHPKGTVVVIEGPRFSSAAESDYFQKQKWEVINMTQYPECILAREMEMCYLNISLVTDYDTGLLKNPIRKGGSSNRVEPVSAKEVVKIFNQNNEKVKKLIFEIIKNISSFQDCPCQHVLKDAMMS